MKRKIFSKLLMVALVIAAVGSFVSCKDYDDDINNLQKQIDAKAAISELTALQSTLEGKISTATAAAQKAAEDAAAKADASLKATLETAIADAKKAGTDAGTEAGKAITAANKAQETADAAAQAAKDADAAAKKALEDALKDIEAKYATKTAADEAVAAALATVAENYATKAEAEEIKTELEGLKENLESAIDEKIAAAIAELDNAAASVEAIWSAVTSVELIPSVKSGNGELAISELYFLKGTEVNNDFGSADAPAGNAAKPYDGNKISEVKQYKDGEAIEFDNRIVVRVNPVNASFTAKDVVLIDSKGNTLNDLVDVVVEPYTQVITRANEYATGLYAISFIRKADATEADFKTATDGAKYDAEENPIVAGERLYAIAINNTKDAAEGRYAATAFELGVWYGDYVAPRSFDFKVKDAKNTWDIADLHNRWCQNDVNTDNNDKLIGDDKAREKVNPGKWNAELVWAPVTDDNKSVAKEGLVDTTSVSTTDAATRNYEWGDSRYAKTDFVKVSKDDRTFTIKGIEQQTLNGVDLNLVQWYYVTLDKFAAVESAPSEWESWNGYEYEGLYTVTRAIDDLKITIKSTTAIGDIIGFRVFAVNYDGSLADPDGRSFYVKVGDVNEVDEKSVVLTGKWTPRVSGTKVGGLAGDVDADDFFGVAPGTAATATAAAGTVAGTAATLTAANITSAYANMIADAIKTTPQYNTGLTPITFPASVNTEGEIAADDLKGRISVPAAEGKAYYGITTTAATVTRAANYVWYQFLDADKNALTSKTKLKNIKYLAVGFENSQNWVDGQTIDIKTGIKVTDPDHHDNIIYTTKISITKQMPAISSGFNWKYTLGPDANGNLNVYMNPATAAGTYAAWDADWAAGAANDYVLATATADGSFTPRAGFTLNDYATFSGVNVYTLRVQDAKKTNVIAAVAGNGNGNHLLKYKSASGNVAAGQFKFDTQYNVRLQEGIADIGCSYEDEAYTRGTYNQTVPNFSKITFKNALQAQSYSWLPYTYKVSATPGGTADQVKTTTDYWLKWSDVAPATAAPIHYYDDATGVDKTIPDVKSITAATGLDLTSIAAHAGGVSATNTVNFVSKDNVTFAGAFKPALYGGTTAATNYYFNGDKFVAKLVSGTNTEYYDVAITAAGVVTFTKGTSTITPTEHTATLKIYAVDYFGNGASINAQAGVGTTIPLMFVGNTDATPIMELPITIKP